MVALPPALAVAVKLTLWLTIKEVPPMGAVSETTGGGLAVTVIDTGDDIAVSPNASVALAISA
jgi:hypothetical protein